MNKLEITLSEETKDFLTELFSCTVSKATASKKKTPVVEDDDETVEDDKLVKKPAKGKANPVIEDDDYDDDDLTGEDDTYTQERVREKCQQLIQDGKAAKLKALLGEFGYAKVVQLKPKDFEKFMTKANKIK